MAFKPDYGLQQMKAGVSPSVDQFFYDFRLYSLTVLRKDQFSTLVDMPLDGKLHALSLDFNRKHLDAILLKADSEPAMTLRSELNKDPDRQRTIEMEEEIVFGVRARLGSLQKSQYECFVPLVTMEIF